LSQKNAAPEAKFRLAILITHWPESRLPRADMNKKDKHLPAGRNHPKEKAAQMPPFKILSPP